MSSRRERRARERAHQALVRDLERLATLAPGGAPERAIPVASVAVIEPMVVRMPCPLCEGPLRVDGHDVSVGRTEPLRTVHARCARCGVARTVFFKVEASTLH